MEEKKSCAVPVTSPNFLGIWDQRKYLLGTEQEGFIQPEKAQREKEEDKNVIETHNGQRDKANEIFKML